MRVISHNHLGLGKFVNLKPINTTTTNSNTTTTIEQEKSTNQYNDINTKIMKITLDTFERLKEHSKRY
jgi:hypothetical protein